MTELEKIQRAKMYIDKMANGFNPLDDSPVSETDIINNVRISRCLFFVSDILRQVIENEGQTKRSKSTEKEKRGTMPFSLSEEQVKNFMPSEKPVCLSDVVDALNAMIDTQLYKKIKYRDISSWLISIGALEEYIDINNSAKKRPTETGESIGIFSEIRRSMRGEYTVILYNSDAQRFIVDNMPAIISYALNPQNTKQSE